MIVQCDYCGKSIDKAPKDIRKYKNHFCSRECRGKWRSNVGKVKKKCLTCNKEFIVNKAREETASFCSVACHNEFQDQKISTTCANCGSVIMIKPSRLQEHNFCSNKCVGEWNGIQRDNKILKKCIICGKEYLVKHCHSDSITCSLECQGKWFSNYYAKRPEVIEFRREIALKNLARHVFKDTKPERIVKQYLIDHNIDFIPQYRCLKYAVDFYLPTLNIVIEVQGDYWHANPQVYGDSEGKKKMTEKQRDRVEKDKIRYNNLIAHGYNTYFVWEKDIYEDVEKSLYFLNFIRII